LRDKRHWHAAVRAILRPERRLQLPACAPEIGYGRPTDRPALTRGLTSLQRTAGNRAVGRMLARRGLLESSGDPNDPREYDDLESYLAGITVLSEQGARELWEDLQRARSPRSKFLDIELKPGRDSGPVTP
jgi:hypothetical protein